MPGEQSRINGRKGAAKQKENLLEGFVNLDDPTSPPVEHTNPYFPSMKAAAHALKIPIEVLKEARAEDCPAFRSGGNVHREQIISWVKNRMTKPLQSPLPENDFNLPDEEFPEPDESGGVGAVLKSLQAYAQRSKQRLDFEQKRTDIHPAVKAKNIKDAEESWLKVAAQLLKYDLSVSLAKRESGELIPIADARKGIEGLLAWHTISASDALRNVIPECEGKNKYQIAMLLDSALRSSIYRNFKLAVKTGKVPEWMGVTVTDFVKGEKPLLAEGEM